MDLVVLVVRTEHVHGHVHGQPNGSLSLRVASGYDGLLPRPRRPARERATEVVLREDDLRRTSTNDRVDRPGSEHAPLGTPEVVECAKKDVIRRQRDGRRIGQYSGDLTPRARAERARFARAAGRRIVDEHDATEGEKTAQPRDLARRQRRDGGVSAPIEKWPGNQRYIVGVKRRWVRARGCARPLDELPRPARGRGRSRRPLPADDEHARVEASVVAERSRGPRQGERQNATRHHESRQRIGATQGHRPSCVPPSLPTVAHEMPGRC